jgi:DNA-binding transcriptional LysR family regulator
MADPLSLNLRHLRALPQIARHGNLRAAAEAASLSQPALTQGLAKLEAQLGAALFERRPAGMAATPVGVAVIERVAAALGYLAQGLRARGARGFARPDRLMTATQLRAFLAVADAGSFAEAARLTDWSQPAIHRAVRDLEQIGGVPLAERRGRGVALSPEGRRLARAIRLARAELVAAIDECAPDPGERGRLTVGAMPLCRARLLPAAISSLMRRAPRARIDVVEGSWRELVEPLRDGSIDLMIGALREETPPLDCIQQPLFADRLAVVARAGHPLAAQAHPDLDALAAYPWVMGRDGTPLRARWEAMFAGRALPEAPVDCGSVMTIRGILVDSDCLTLLSPDQVAMEVASGILALIPTPAPMTRTIGVTTRAGWRPTRIQSLFLDSLGAAAQ